MMSTINESDELDKNTAQVVKQNRIFLRMVTDNKEKEVRQMLLDESMDIDIDFCGSSYPQKLNYDVSLFGMIIQIKNKHHITIFVDKR